MAFCRENGLSETHASMLHAFCACNYIRLPLTRQHKTSVSVSRFAPLRHFQYKINCNAAPLFALKPCNSSLLFCPIILYNFPEKQTYENTKRLFFHRRNN